MFQRTKLCFQTPRVCPTILGSTWVTMYRTHFRGALLGVSCDSRQGPFLGDSAVLKSRRMTVKKGEKATATLFYLFSTATYFKKRQRHWHREGQRRLRHSVYSSFCNGANGPIIEYENSAHISKIGKTLWVLC